jgi:D-aminopeptidase
MLKAGPKNLLTDVTGLRVGNAVDERIKSGTTAVLFDQATTASYAVMGGAPGTRETDLLQPDKSVQGVDALILSGGSAFGLDAASGVAERLRAKGRGFAVGDKVVPICPSAIVFDLMNGGDKSWDTSPYTDLGRAAFDAATIDFDIGRAGGGFGATCGQTVGGLGSASLDLGNGAMVAALTIANPVGNVMTPDGKHFWAAPFEIDNEFGGYGAAPSQSGLIGMEHSKLRHLIEGANTTIGVVATNVKLDKAQCQRVATAAHDGIARAIVPSHLPHDGDLLFCAATGEVAMSNEPIDFAMLCHAASICVARAIARGVYEAMRA